jgi:thiol-disulfide isomerase/thioredoxin
MSQRLFSILLLCGLLASPLFLADIALGDDDAEKPAAEAKQPEAKETATLAEQVQENPNDAKLLNKYVGSELNQIFPLIRSNPAAAEKSLVELKANLDKIEATEAPAKALLSRAHSVVDSFQDRIALSRVTLEEATAQLKASPAEEKLLANYVGKVMEAASSTVRSEPAKAEEQIATAKTLLNELSEQAEEEAVQKRLAKAVDSFARLDRSIASAKKLLELVGKDSSDLVSHVEGWANGEALTEGDLKGKVVLLDFWAVWCGPCIATFPHLREWQETYADKGLVIVGLTRYYGYEWNEEAGRATRSKEKVTPEAEQEMLTKFAEEHDLKHRFAIQKGSELSDYYAVSGIPHVVLIDQEGKVRMVKVGSGPQNAKAISELLAELLK